MAKYEYVLVGRDQAEKLDHITEIVNYHGSQGYRLTLVSDWFFCFEREFVTTADSEEDIERVLGDD